MERHNDLDIRHDLDYHRRLFIFQRIGWAMLTLFLLAALLGLIGAEGPLNAGTAGNDALRLEYERFPHQESRTQLQITLRGSAERGGRLELWVDAGYLSNVRVERISPEPNAVIADRGGLGYVFVTARPDDSATMAVQLTPQSAGRLDGEVRAGREGAPVRFSQFVYP
jgi:hypothetical protein